MINEKNRIIYVDYSTLAQFQACHEKARLGNVNGWRAKERKASLDFGHALHAAFAAYYDALAGGFHATVDKGTDKERTEWFKFGDNDADAGTPLVHAKAAFLRDLGHT